MTADILVYGFVFGFGAAIGGVVGMLLIALIADKTGWTI